MFGMLCKKVEEILGKEYRVEEVAIKKAATMYEHVHIYVSIPPKSCVSKVIG